MVVHRDPKRADNIAPLTKGQSWTDFCVQLTLGTYPGPVWNKEVTQNGFGPCRSLFHGNEEWHLLQPDNSFDATQIDIYHTMRKNSFT